MSESGLHDISSAGETYVRYCAGLAIVQAPENFVELHNRPNIEGNTDEILCTAERLMVDGVRGFIKASLPDNIATLQQASSRYDEVAPGMHSKLAYAVSSNKKRLYDINKAYLLVTPAPFMNRGIFTDITHSNYNRIHTVDMLENYAWNPVFDDLIPGRTLSNVKAIQSRLRLVKND